MMPGESKEQFAARLKNARREIDAAEAIMAAIQEHPIPTNKVEREVLKAVSEMKERALDFLRNE